MRTAESVVEVVEQARHLAIVEARKAREFLQVLKQLRYVYHTLLHGRA